MPYRRPTFLPSSKLKPARPAAKEGPTQVALKGFVDTLADLARPKAVLALLHDDVRLGVFEDGIFAALDEQPGELQDNEEIVRVRDV